MTNSKNLILEFQTVLGRFEEFKRSNWAFKTDLATLKSSRELIRVSKSEFESYKELLGVFCNYEEFQRAIASFIKF